MIFKDLIKLLEDHKEAALRIMLPSGEFVPDHFHITEVGKVGKAFIDCGGNPLHSCFCVLQVWTANDVEHRLNVEKLIKILEIGDKTFNLCNLPVEVEYGSDVAAYYALANVEVTPKGLLLVLIGKKTNCLATDKCGVNKCKSSNCC